MKYLLILTIYTLNVFSIDQIVYVESPTDTDKDGKNDLIYVEVTRPDLNYKLPTKYTISPYSLGGDDSVQFHNTDHNELPQNKPFTYKKIQIRSKVKYAIVHAHSLGTGHSTGCPTVGDINETLAGKAVIDWLNGTNKAYDKKGKEVFASWANGNVGMTGVSYNGTLPTMIATTGVKGLKAIIPMAAISNWYNYYRSNGLVVSPGGYIGEDADILGHYIIRKNACKQELAQIFKSIDRKTGDFSNFWQERNYITKASKIKAATFIVHGQRDWNVRQRHAIELWESLKNTPKKMLLFNGGHSSYDYQNAVSKWFDYYVAEVSNDVNQGPQVWVEDQYGKMTKQYKWPSEKTETYRFNFLKDFKLSTTQVDIFEDSITDIGSRVKIKELLKNNKKYNESKLEFLTTPVQTETLFSGTPVVNLNLSIINKNSANLTVVIFEERKNKSRRIITRGWADPQNYRDISNGEFLNRGKKVSIQFTIEPKQYTIKKSSRVGVMITSTDYNHTLRPKPGTEILFNMNKDSFVQMNLSKGQTQDN